MSGSLENVGWSKPGQESLYNIVMMEELHTVVSLLSAARDTRRVSPMPCCNRLPMPIEDFTIPIRAVPAWVMPTCKG